MLEKRHMTWNSSRDIAEYHGVSRDITEYRGGAGRGFHVCLGVSTDHGEFHRITGVVTGVSPGVVGSVIGSSGVSPDQWGCYGSVAWCHWMHGVSPKCRTSWGIIGYHGTSWGIAGHHRVSWGIPGHHMGRLGSPWTHPGHRGHPGTPGVVGDTLKTNRDDHHVQRCRGSPGTHWGVGDAPGTSLDIMIMSGDIGKRRGIARDRRDTPGTYRDDNYIRRCQGSHRNDHKKRP